jgi:glycine dehydrogenase subunit 2
VNKALTDFLPVPRIIKTDDRYEMMWNCPDSIGRVKAFYGNFNVLVKAYTYLRALGPEGVKKVSEMAVLNANFVRERLKRSFDLAYDRTCMHECVFSGARQAKECGVHTLDIAKRLLDCGYHPPTIYFPLVVPEAIMIEPTETESLETLDRFCDEMITIARETQENPSRVKSAPVTTPVGRLDDVKVAREPDVCMKGS